jgi:tetratricopeptide (TPR) repeat protein
MMKATTRRRRILGVLTILAIAALATTVKGQSAEALREFLAIHKQYEKTAGDGDYTAAALLAKRMRDIAERRLTRSADALALAVRCQGRALCGQGRYGEAEPLLVWVLHALERIDGRNADSVAVSLDDLGSLYHDQGRYADAEPLHNRALAISEKSHGPEHPNVATNLNSLANVYAVQGRYAEAEPLYQRSLAIREKVFGPEHPRVAAGLSNLAGLYDKQGHYAEAEPLYQRSLAIREKVFGPEHPRVATGLSNLAGLYDKQGHYAQAEPLYRRALAIREKVFGPEHSDVATSLSKLAGLYDHQGRYAEAEPLYQRALAIREKVFGPEHPDVATSLNNLALLYDHQGRYTEAEPLYQRSLAIDERVFGPEHPDVAASRANLAGLYDEQGRYAEAELLYKRALAIDEKVLGHNHPSVATILNNLAGVYRDQGRYAEAEPLYKRALAIYEKVLGPEHPWVATILNNLALLYANQGRNAEAEPLYQRSLAIREKVFGPEHPDVAQSLANLAGVYDDQGRYAEAELLYRRALTIKEKVLGPEHPDVAISLNALAVLRDHQGRDAEVEPLYQRSLAIREKVLGPEHPSVARVINNLSWLYYEQGRYTEAEPLVDRAIALKKRARAAPGDRSIGYKTRAEISWKLERKSEAMADLRQAMGLAEQQRAMFSGAGQQRAQAFAGLRRAYEVMIAWQTELGDVAEAFIASERGRARSLVDEMAAANVDLLAGLPEQETEQLRGRETEANARVASLEKQLEVLDVRKDVTDEERESQRQALREQLVKARQELVDAYVAIRNASPAYRRAVGKEFLPVKLDEIQHRLAGEDGLVLEYVLGKKVGYLFVIPAVGGRPHVVELDIDQEQAEQVDVEAGPLTAERMKDVLSSGDEQSLLQTLGDPKQSDQATDKLAALWQVLVPEAERKALTDGSVKHLVVVPDGMLALLPFETLVVEKGQQPKYLLDAGPPILYGPSATVIYNLIGLPTADEEEEREPILTVGNPAYADDTVQLAAATTDLTQMLAARSRYHGLGGQLSPLMYSGWESSWVAEVFGKQGVDAAQLSGSEATEATVRRLVTGRQVIHLACHGLADQSYGNFFGALALTPGDEEDAANDGFLTLPEIYELDLDGCELAILSACETNYGPEQKGEGVWSLSRGFLVAGSRRVVASNWLVDDEAAANLVSVFCTYIARAEKEGKLLDYAESLQKAKRWVRNQEKWSSPYYWGTFVLVGPN